jgi:hypothetical protein
MLDGFTTTQVCEVHNLNLERLKDWMRRGYVRPTKPAPKQGKKATFLLPDVYGIGLFKDLIENGYKRDAAAEYVRRFLTNPKAIDAHYILFRPKAGGPIEATILGPGESKICLENAVAGSGPQRAENLPPWHPGPSTTMGDKNWMHMHFVNFKNLKKRIDNAIASLLQYKNTS